MLKNGVGVAEGGDIISVDLSRAPNELQEYSCTLDGIDGVQPWRRQQNASINLSIYKGEMWSVCKRPSLFPF